MYEISVVLDFENILIREDDVGQISAHVQYFLRTNSYELVVVKNNAITLLFILFDISMSNLITKFSICSLLLFVIHQSTFTQSPAQPIGCFSARRFVCNFNIPGARNHTENIPLPLPPSRGAPPPKSPMYTKPNHIAHTCFHQIFRASGC